MVSPGGTVTEHDGPAVDSGPGPRRGLVLTVLYSPKAVDPTVEFVARRVRDAMVQGRYAVLEAAPQRYVQAGSGPWAGLRGRPGYAVEYRDGSPDAHFRFVTTDVDVVVAVFEAYARNDSSFARAHPWRPYPFGRRLGPPSLR